MMILINGGSSSGKSAFAETLIREQSKKEEVMAEAAGKSMRGGARKTDLRHQPSFYLATMIAWDNNTNSDFFHFLTSPVKNFLLSIIGFQLWDPCELF